MSEHRDPGLDEVWRGFVRRAEDVERLVPGPPARRARCVGDVRDVRAPVTTVTVARGTAFPLAAALLGIVVLVSAGIGLGALRPPIRPGSELGPKPEPPMSFVGDASPVGSAGRTSSGPGASGGLIRPRAQSTWQRIDWEVATLVEEAEDGPPPGEIRSVAAAGSTLVAVGYIGVSEAAPPLVWSSSVTADGRAWRQTPLPYDADREAVHVAEVVATTRGFVAVGKSVTGGGTPGGDGLVEAAAVWRSSDGVSWERVRMEPVVAEDAVLDGAATDGTTIIGYGHTFESRPAIWISPDGASWSRIAAADAPGTGVDPDAVVGEHELGSAVLATVNDVTSMDGRWVAVGSIGLVGDQQDATAWVSDDGLRWDLHDIDTTYVYGNSHAAARQVVSMGGVLLAHGIEAAACPDDGECGVAWRSPDGQTWDRVRVDGTPLADPRVRLAPAEDVGFVGVQGASVTTSLDGALWPPLVPGAVPLPGPRDVAARAVTMTDLGLLVGGTHNTGSGFDRPFLAVGHPTPVWLTPGGTPTVGVVEGPGPAHCGWDAASFLSFFREPVSAEDPPLDLPEMTVIRDPGGVVDWAGWGVSETERYAGDVDLPADAAPVGIGSGRRELWTSASAGRRVVFVVTPERVERWGWGEEILCR